MIEHMVLQGSEKYPVKDLYLELEKRSMATFAYGNTGSDRTVYLCSCINKNQYMKLVSVYMDIVFHPLMGKNIFHQEAYRLDIDGSDSEGDLVHNGVVYNEVKGIASDQFRYVIGKCQNGLYPDSSSGRSFAGDYRSVPDISYEILMEYYRDHYHPSNCCLFSITGVPFNEMAELLEAELTGFDSYKPPVELQEQTPFDAPLEVCAAMPGRDDGKCIALSTWVMPSGGDIVYTLAWSILGDILCGHDNSPIKSRLVCSVPDTSLFSNFTRRFKQNDLSIGLFGVDKAEGKKVFQRIQKELKDLIDTGINPELVNGAVKQQELKQRKKGDYWSESTLWKVCEAWAYGEDVMLLMDSHALFESLKHKLFENPKLFEDMISRDLLNNPHMLNGVFCPDEEHFRCIDEEIRMDLHNLKKSMSEDEITELITGSENLKKYLDKPVNKADLLKLPIPAIAGIDEFLPPPLFYNEEKVENKLILTTAVNTYGVCCVDLCFDVSDLPFELISHLAFFEKYLTKTGADDLDYQEMLAYELSCSSGIAASTIAVPSTIASAGEYRIVFRISGYCLPEDLSSMLSAMGKRAFQPELSNPDRILTAAREIENEKRGSVIYRGNEQSILMAKAGLSTVGYVDNLLHGLPSLQNTALINKNTVDTTIEALSSIHYYISEVSPRILIWSGAEAERSIATEWFTGLPGSRADFKKSTPPALPAVPVVTGVETHSISTSIGMAVKGIPQSHPLAASGIVAMEMVDEFLINEIMLKGGAYTGGVYMEDGAILLYSYRDPSPARSLSIFQQIKSSCKNLLHSKSDNFDDYILSALKKMNPVLRPATANQDALRKFLKGGNRVFKKSWSKALLSVTEDSVGEFCICLEQLDDTPYVCVISNRSTLGAMNIDDRICV